MAIIYACLLYMAIVSGVATDRCITCERDTLEVCTNGKETAEFEEQIQQCAESLPYCEVIIQERLEPGSEPELLDVTRGCVKDSKFECTNTTDTSTSEIRTCTATCQGDLCNDFEDAAARVAAQKKQAGSGSPTAVIVLPLVLMPLAVLGA